MKKSPLLLCNCFFRHLRGFFRNLGRFSRFLFGCDNFFLVSRFFGFLNFCCFFCFGPPQELWLLSCGFRGLLFQPACVLPALFPFASSRLSFFSCSSKKSFEPVDASSALPTLNATAQKDGHYPFPLSGQFVLSLDKVKTESPVPVKTVLLE